MIRAVFFDAGGVLMTADGFENSFLARRLGLDEKKFLRAVEKYQDACESGKVSDKKFLQYIAKSFSLNYKKLRKKWLEIYQKKARPRKSVYRIAFVLKKRGLRVGIISNTKRMYTPFNKKRKIYAGFTIVILSYNVGFTKPNKKIYALACRRAHVKPQEAVFIDDRIKNVKGAKAFGMKAIWYKNPQQLKRELKKLNVKF